MADNSTSERPSKKPRLAASFQDAAVLTEADYVDQSSSKDAFQITQDQKEIDVGISAFVATDSDGFKALLKVRYTDFLVNEVLPNGNVAHLTSTVVPEHHRVRGKVDKTRPQDDPAARPKTSNSQIAITGSEVHNAAASGAADNAVNDQEFKNPNTNQISEDDKQQLIRYFDAQTVSELLTLYQSTIKYPQKKAKDHPVVRAEFTTDRSLRAEIHGFIRRIFFSQIESSTDKDGVLVLAAASINHNNGPRNDDNKPSWRPGKLGWIERGGEYLHFTLYKENKDTMEAVSYLVRQMKINAKVFQFAGTKDRRAVTTQRVSAYRVDVERLASQNRFLRASCVGDFAYEQYGLELGDLTGNEFTITLRDCQFPSAMGLGVDETIDMARKIGEKAMASLHADGYLNYYGLQRFGTFATRTDMVGVHILKGDLKAAVEAILHFDPRLVPEDFASNVHSHPTDGSRFDRSVDTSRAIALALYKKDSQLAKAIEILPRKFSAEICLLRQLHRNPTDYYGALMSIQRNMRLMYVHAYQSLVWNHATSHRMQIYGNQIVEGDLVLVSEHQDKNEHPVQTQSDSKSAPSDVSTDNVDADGEVIIAPSIHDRSNNPDDVFERARPLTAAEASSGKYNIFDIVLPLPGYDILYPNHETGAFYKTFMAANGGLDPMDMRRKQREFSLSGGYRKILSRIGPSWTVDVRSYTRDEEQFVQTDLEIIKERTKKAAANQDADINTQQSSTQEENGDKEAHRDNDDLRGLASAATQQPEMLIRENANIDADGNIDAVAPSTKIAMILKFQLGASQYATMALRELSRGGIVGYQPDFSGTKTTTHKDDLVKK